MSFQEFTFPKVQEDFNLNVGDADLFANTPDYPTHEALAGFIRHGTVLAAAINTEKAKSEFIIAPVLLELHRISGESFSIFSGVEWNPDPIQGLNGYCDFILTKGKSQYILGTPFVAIVEAKKDDIFAGLGQCIAAMWAAQLCNQKSNTPLPQVHGIVTNGTNWKFLRLEETSLTIDKAEYHISNLPKIMGILREIVENAKPLTGK